MYSEVGTTEIVKDLLVLAFENSRWKTKAALRPKGSHSVQTDQLGQYGKGVYGNKGEYDLYNSFRRF